jgi:hypothetical protein
MLHWIGGCVGSDRSDDGNVTKTYEEEIDEEGFITVRTKKTKREMKRSKTVTWNDIEIKKCKSVSRAFLLKQCCKTDTTDNTL